MSRRVSWCFVLAFSLGAIAGACSADRPDNRPPELTAQVASTDEDVPVAIHVLDGASDPDGDRLTVTSAYAPDHMVDVVAGTTVMLTPKQDFNGTIIVTYNVSDGLHMVTGQVTVTVRSLNDKPVAIGGLQLVHGRVAVVLEGRDVDGDALSFEIVTGPSHGAITGDPPVLHYAPAASFAGDDAITFRVRDAALASEPATIQLQVSEGSAPVAKADALTGDEDAALAVVLRGQDVDDNPLTFRVVTQPTHGALSGDPPNLTYTPEADFNGTDSLEFVVSDGYVQSDTARVAITVRPVNDRPVATAQSVDATEDTARDITLAGSDIDGDPLTFAVVTAEHGTVTGSGATRTYTPDANFHGTDHITFTASDGRLTSNPATVTVEVASVEDAPVADAIARNLDEDVATAIALTGSDGDGDALSFAIVDPPAHGTLSGTPPAVTYTPAADYNGPDSFTYTASDGNSASAAATVSLTVKPVNDAPVATDSTVPATEDTPVAITLPATDIDSTALTYTIVTPPSDGTLTGIGAARTYTPAANANGPRSFTFRVSDGSLSATATVTINIAPVNDQPTAADDFVATEPDTAFTFGVLDNDSDVDGDPLAIDSVAAPAHGTVEIVDGHLHYTPASGFQGTDVFDYTATDSHGGFATGHAHVGVGLFPPGAPLVRISAGVPTNSNAFTPAISGNGRYLAFATAQALVDDDTDGFIDIYLYDRSTATLKRVSVATGGGQANGDSLRPDLSADGRYISFESGATNLVPGDTNGRSDVFRHDRVTGETVRVSVATGGGQASGLSTLAQISDDGNLVVFSSFGFELVASDANGAEDVFVRDVAAGTTTRVSVGATGSEGDLGSTQPAISGDGRFVAFTSAATNLVPGDSNAFSDVFVRDRVAGTTVRVSVSSTGGQANQSSSAASLSRDGRFVSFLSNATNLVPGVTTSGQSYVRDLQEGTTTRPVFLGTSSRSARLSDDGRYMSIYDQFAGVVIRDRFAAVTSSSANWFWPAISGSGRYMVALDAFGSVVVLPNPL